VAIFACAEKYEELFELTASFRVLIKQLFEHGFDDFDHRHHDVDLFLTSDMKMMLLLLGLNCALSFYFCFLGFCTSDERKSYDHITSHSHNSISAERIKQEPNKQDPRKALGVKYEAFFPFIPMDHLCLDILHLLLRTTDHLEDLLIDDLVSGYSGNDPDAIFLTISAAYQAVGIQFHFWPAKDEAGTMNHTSLQGPDKVPL
jgi:hypothetical protein